MMRMMMKHMFWEMESMTELDNDDENERNT